MAVERFILARLSPEWSTEEGRRGTVELARTVFRPLAGAVARVGAPADAESTRSWDLAIVVRADSVAELGVVLGHPVWQAFEAAVLLPRTAVMKAWVFEVG